MNWFTIIPLLLLVAVNHFTEATTESNEIFPTGTTQTKGRTKLRRLVIPIEPADDAESSLGSSNNVENATNKDEILEESTVRDKMSVHFYSANVDTETNTEGDLLKYLLEKVGSPANNDSKLFIKYSPTERSVSTTAAADSEINSSNDIPAISRNSVKKDEQKKSKESKSQIEEPTTTSKPAPTHNEDGENIEVVDKKDIKILQAPLVSAFTVHQDGIGLPKKVIPLIPSALQPTPIPVVQLSSISFPGRSPFVQSNLISPTESPLINHQPIPLQLPVPSFLRPEALQKHYNELRGGFIQQPSITPNPISLPIQQQVSQPARDLLPPLNAIPTQSIQQIQPVPQIIPAQSIQQIQPVPQIIPTFSVLPQQPAIIQNQQQLQLQQALLERQKLLEEQIFLLQNQARHQQQQIFLQQQLLQEHRRKRFENESGQPNQLTANNVISGKSKLINEIPQVTSKPQLEIFKSVTQAPRYEVSTQQHLPVREAVPFHRNPATFNQQSSKSAKVEIQASTQLNVNQSQQKNAASPRELSSTLQLPLRSFQAFRLNGNQNAGAQAQQQHLLQQQLLQQQQQQQQQQYQQQYQQQLFQRQQQALLQQQQQQQQQLFQQQILQAQQQQIARNRNFRSELQTGNFGLNSNFIPQQSFAPQTTPADIQLQSLLYQSALNHGINPRIPQNLQIPFPFGNF